MRLYWPYDFAKMKKRGLEMKKIICTAVLMCLISITGAAKDYNPLVVEAVDSMPDGGRYSKLDDATIALGKAITSINGRIKVDPLLASPVYCSGASYLAFIHVISKLQADGLNLPTDIVDALLVKMQPDGTDTWGRWNANGPGTSRLFFELGLGPNFVDWKDARPGDFMKIFFTDQIGRYERGHSVVFLGLVRKSGKEYLRYWSSDAPDGRGTHEMLKSRVYRAVFSRLEHPEALANISKMPRTDAYLASMLTESSTVEQMYEKIGSK